MKQQMIKQWMIKKIIELFSQIFEKEAKKRLLFFDKNLFELLFAICENI